MLVGGVGLRLDASRAAAGSATGSGRRFWGHGVASEAAGRLARWALANLDLDRLVADRRDRQPASVAVLRRIGFRQVGEGDGDVPGPRRRAAGAALRGDARRPVRHSRRPTPRGGPAASRCCWSPPAR